MASRSVTLRDRPNLNSKLKVKFQGLHETLVKEHLLPIIDHLYSEDVISEDVQYKLRHMPTERDQSRELLSILQNSQHPLAFVKVHEAMMKDGAYKPILEQLKKFKDVQRCSEPGPPRHYQLVRNAKCRTTFEEFPLIESDEQRERRELIERHLTLGAD